MWKGSASKSLQRMQNSLLGRSAPTLLKRPSVLLARSVIYHPFGVEQIDFHPDQEERLLNACQTIVAIASVMQSFKM